MKYQKWLDESIDDLSNKTIIVTGANSGIGYYCTKNLVYKNAKVIMACRNKIKATNAKESILKEFPNASLEIEILDISSFYSIRNFVERIKDKDIYALINNAGVYFMPKNTFTEDGLEITIGTNYFGVYYLTTLLEKSLTIKEELKIINVTSITHKYAHIDLNDLKLEKETSRNGLYAKSKLALAAYTYAKQCENKDKIKYYLVHPGISATNIIASKEGGFSKLFSYLGTKFMKIFFHSPAKASLVLIKPFSKKDKDKYNFGPRILQISGYPKSLKVTKKQKKLKKIINETNKVIESMNCIEL